MGNSFTSEKGIKYIFFAATILLLISSLLTTLSFEFPINRQSIKINQPTYTHHHHSINKAETMALTSTSTSDLPADGAKYPIVGPESIMSDKAHGTCLTGVQSELRWDVDQANADRY